MLVTSLKKRISHEILKDVFTFSYERLKRYEGDWHLEETLMFPEYIFLESDNPQLLYEEIKTTQSLFEYFDGNGVLMQVNSEEEKLLKSLYGSTHLLPISRGYIRDGVTYVTEGPLRGKEKMICRIDRHKRIARLNTAFLKQPHQLIAGLEIVSKS